METFQLYRLALIERVQPDLYDFDNDISTREQCIRRIFSNHFKFDHRGNEFHYVPKNVEGLIIGKIGREKVFEESSSPSEGLSEMERKTWQASVIVVDPSDSEDGQKLAMQWLDLVGKPSSILKSMIIAVNNDYPRIRFSFEIDEIVDVTNFWSFVSANEGKITQVTFDVPVPNMFGSSDTWDQDLKDARDKERAKRVKVTYNNDDGELDANTDRIKEAVDYTDRCSGNITARAKDKASFNSSESSKFTRIQVNDDQTTIEAVISQVRRVLGRE